MLRKWPFLAAPVAAVAILIASASSAFADACKSYSGTFTAVRPDVCASPVNPPLCTHGTLVGGFPSTYDFTADTLVPTGIPNQSAYTGHSVITTPPGAMLFGKDSGVLTDNGNGTGSFVTTVQIVGGTRQYEGATGTFVAPGVLTFSTGATVGTYTATICTAEDVQG